MDNRTYDLDDYIIAKSIKNPEFEKEFNAGYEKFKIGAIIKGMRIESGMTQEELAEKLDIKKSVISRMENHSDDVKLSTLQKAAAVFGKQLKIAML